MKNAEKIIVALDFAQAETALNLAQQLKDQNCKVKVGKELFTRAGPDLVRKLTDMGLDVFLDLKYHDIPNTVAKACQAAADLNVWMLNVHALGGKAMLSAAREALEGYPQRPKLIAVTILTSLHDDELTAVGLSGNAKDNVLRLANLAHDSGLDGVVCSPREIQPIRAQLPESFQLVTPGIRPAGSASDDQTRTLTPEQALLAGANYLVIGRPITAASDPVAALDNIRESLGTI
ncbi:orotidine-5'-phosphate decarboxylase [Candidatus Venteria ishoeyi]|uniref:Orotidine 5'-phosphate decarboxylase n=1 Tax=Candidatus Venteria ishoeyi TaxID=1899563 RepID=A0A1H6FB16_9GAMM|nr:orotidine-5'-phosphate decarboxylase [Candidatus Venteria ishoeyi]SEH07282.1 Orotidine 5'-phosphate decarboxylase [Candidatus Venteria ishoeyi]